MLLRGTRTRPKCYQETRNTPSTRSPLHNIRHLPYIYDSKAIFYTQNAATALKKRLVSGLSLLLTATAAPNMVNATRERKKKVISFSLESNMKKDKKKEIRYARNKSTVENHR